MVEKGENGKQNEKLFDAVKRGATIEVEELLAQGVSADSRDDKERTPLIVAAEGGNPDIAQKLLDFGTEVNAVDLYGETALMAATYSGHIDVVKLLVSKGADLEIRNNEGVTALELAQEMEVNAVTAFLAAQAAGSTSLAKAVASTDPDDDEPTTDGPAATSAAAAMLESPEPQSYVQELDLELIPEPGRSTYFKPHREPEIATKNSDDEAVGSPLNPPDNVIAAGEERIVFDAWDNKQVRSVNEKAKKTLEKAGLELGNYTVDTVFKGNYMAVLNPRSKEIKRFRKLGKHPELMIDPRRWTEWTGGAAVKRYCLGEGIDVSSLSGSHFVELYYVKDRDLILVMAEKANSNQYTIRQLKQAIGDLKDERDDLDAGRAIIKTLDQSLPLLEEPELVALCADKERLLQELSKAERKKILTLVKKRKPGLNEWKKLMETLEGILNELEE